MNKRLTIVTGERQNDGERNISYDKNVYEYVTKRKDIKHIESTFTHEHCEQ